MVLRKLDNYMQNNEARGSCVGQSVKRQTLDFGSGHDLTVHEFEFRIGLYANNTEPAWDSLSPFTLPLPSLCSLSLSKINKLIKMKLDLFLTPYTKIS